MKPELLTTVAGREPRPLPAPRRRRVGLWLLVLVLLIAAVGVRLARVASRPSRYESQAILFITPYTNAYFGTEFRAKATQAVPSIRDLEPWSTLSPVIQGRSGGSNGGNPGGFAGRLGTGGGDGCEAVRGGDDPVAQARVRRVGDRDRFRNPGASPHLEGRPAGRPARWPDAVTEPPAVTMR